MSECFNPTLLPLGSLSHPLSFRRPVAVKPLGVHPAPVKADALKPHLLKASPFSQLCQRTAILTQNRNANFVLSVSEGFSLLTNRLVPFDRCFLPVFPVNLRLKRKFICINKSKR